MRFSSDSIDTLAAHAGRDGFAALGVHAPPIDLSSTYPFPDLDQATEAFDAFAAGAAGLVDDHDRLLRQTVLGDDALHRPRHLVGTAARTGRYDDFDWVGWFPR